MIGENIRAYRKQLGFSTEEISSFLNINTETLQHFEDQIKDVGIENLEKLANLFGIETYDFFKKSCNAINNSNLTVHLKGKMDIIEIAKLQKILKNYSKITKALLK